MTTKPHSPFNLFVDVYVDELIAMPDEQVLEGLDALALQAAGADLLARAKSAAGKRRFAAARTSLAAAKERKFGQSRAELSVDDARKYVAQAANDPRYTLAARNLSEMSDADVISVYWQMKDLEKANASDFPQGDHDR